MAAGACQTACARAQTTSACLPACVSTAYAASLQQLHSALPRARLTLLLLALASLCRVCRVHATGSRVQRAACCVQRCCNDNGQQRLPSSWRGSCNTRHGCRGVGGAWLVALLAGSLLAGGTAGSMRCGRTTGVAAWHVGAHASCVTNCFDSSLLLLLLLSCRFATRRRSPSHACWCASSARAMPARGS